MNKRLYILALFCVLSLAYAYAETIILRTGARVKGEIIYETEDYIVLQDAEGARFQFLRFDIQEILLNDPSAKESSAEAEPKRDGAVKKGKTASANAASPKATSPQPAATEGGIQEEVPKKVSVLLELAGGAGIIPNEKAGGAFAVNFLVGSHHIGSRHIFAGAGLGYHGSFLGAEKYNFLPIQAVLRAPLTEKKHAPVCGLAIGYGIGLSKDYTGGLYAGIDFGYRCQINPKSALALVAFAQFQQATVKTIETVEGTEFINKTGRNLIMSGLKFALYF